MKNYRIGTGYDVHRLKDGLKLMIGGLEIIHFKGCEAHSDGDVLIHAICDSLLGAANFRDIGYNFPDTDNNYKDIDSKILLKRTIKLLRDNNFEIGNIDSTIVLQKPKISNYIPEMKKVLASVLSIEENQISIKATTTEKLGLEGTEDGISAQAVSLIYSK